MSAPKHPVQMGVVGAPHGVKGEVRVKTFTEDPLRFGDYGPLYAADGRAFTVAEVRPAKAVVVVRFREVTSREQAEALNGTALFVDRSALPEELEEEEFYHADLIGLRIEDESGETIGNVMAVHNFGGGDILEINVSPRGTALVPFSKAAVPVVDIPGGRLRIDSMAAGLDDGGQQPFEDGAAERRSRAKKARGNR